MINNEVVLSNTHKAVLTDTGLAASYSGQPIVYIDETAYILISGVFDLDTIGNTFIVAEVDVTPSNTLLTYPNISPVHLSWDYQVGYRGKYLGDWLVEQAPWLSLGGYGDYGAGHWYYSPYEPSVTAGTKTTKRGFGF